jgi:DNA-binding NarL/FixJ family response regulator
MLYFNSLGIREFVMRKTSVLIVDDEKSIRVSLEALLKRNNFYVKSVNSASMALNVLENDHYDIVLSDIMLAGMTGVELLEKIKADFVGISVLLMTGYSNLNSAIAAVRLGASDYLIKPCSSKEILSSIARSIKSNTIRKKKELTQYLKKKQNTLPGEKPLTKRELEVYSYVVSGMSDKAIAKELAVTLPTIKFHLQNIYRKLGFNGRKGILGTISLNNPY